MPNIQSAKEEHLRALAAGKAAADASIHAVEAQLVAAAHGAALAERAAEQEAATLRAGVSAARGERRASSRVIRDCWMTGQPHGVKGACTWHVPQQDSDVHSRSRMTMHVLVPWAAQMP